MKVVKCRIPTPYPFEDEKREQKIRKKILNSLKKIRDSFRAKSRKNKKITG